MRKSDKMLVLPKNKSPLTHASNCILPRPSDEFSTAESLQREHPWLSRVLASEADRYRMSMFPGFTLAKHEIQEENGLMVGHFHLEPVGDPICPQCGKPTSRIKDTNGICQITS